MELFVLLILLGALLLAETRLYMHQWSRNLTYVCTFSTDEAYEGDEIELIETVTNAKALPLAWAKAEISASKWLAFAGSQSVVAGDTRYVPSFFVLKSHHRVVRRWKVKCLRRGVYTLGKTVLVTTDLLGRHTFSLPVELHAELTVLPRPQEPEDCLVVPNSLNGDTVVRRRLLTDPFFVNGVREYTPHDAANRIHWAATAKEDRIMVRSNDCTSDQTVTVLLNMQTRFDEGAQIIDSEDIEHGIRTAATVIAETAGRGLPARLIANGGEPGGTPLATGQGAGEEFALDLLRVLARMQITKSENFRSYADQARGAILSTDLIVISSYLDDVLTDFARERESAGIHVRLMITRAIDYDALPDDCDVVFCLPEETTAAGSAAQEEVAV